MAQAEVTIRDVAAHAGCSIATVSRVATGSGPVSEAMRRRVVAAALALGFDVSRSAAPKRPIVCVLLPSITNPVFAGALDGIEHCARKNGLSTLVAQSNYDASQEEKVVAALIAERPVGLILTVCDPSTSAALANVARQELPVVTIYNEGAPAGVGSVFVDNRTAMRRMTEELLVLGHRSILFVGGRFASSDRSIARYEGYCDALRAAGCTPLPPLEVDFIEGSRDIELTMMMDAHRPSAVVASNDLLAITTIASLHRLGLSVPEDVSVSGFDGIELARHMSPQLTTIVQPSRTMGVLAASMVLDIAAGRRSPDPIRVDFSLFRGETITSPGPCTRAGFPSAPSIQSNGSIRP